MPFAIQWVEHCSGAEQIITVETPAGKLALTVRQDVITQCDWAQDDAEAQPSAHEIQRRIADYWLNPDSMIPIKLLKQGTDYRNKVWSELCRIPFGETLTYSALAGKIGSAARAVGNACRDNPFPLIIPCHRVVSVSGLGGYSGQTEGDSMAIKIKLLELEATGKK